MKPLISLLQKRPFQVLAGLALGVVVLAFGVSSISLSTGNETLIEPDSTTYQDNLTYQDHFGTDPIVVVFQGAREELLSMESLQVLNDLNEAMKRNEDVLYSTSPIVVLEATNAKRIAQFELALAQMATGLATMADTIRAMDGPDGFDPALLDGTLESLLLAQQTISTGLSNEVDGMTTLRSAVTTERTTLEQSRDALDPIADQAAYDELTQTIQLLTNVEGFLSQFIQINTEFANGTSQTATALDAIHLQLASLATQLSDLTANLGQLADTLSLFSTNLNQIASSFDGIGPTFPQETSTLQQLVRPGGTTWNPMLDVFFLDDAHLMVRIVPVEGSTDQELASILDDIDASLAGTIHVDALISGKPVLDLDIRASMMDSMKIMMITAGVVMIVVLMVLFPVRMRWLPLVVVLMAVIVTVGIMGHASIPLTMVSMAVFPVLIGLGIDYSIQFHSRYQEELEGGQPHA